MEEMLTTAVVFVGIYQIIKAFTDYLLKRKIISAGHIDKAGILEYQNEKEEKNFPALKWGLVVLFAGLGLVVIEIIQRNQGQTDMNWMRNDHSFLPVGIELISVSLGFLIYFVISRFVKKQ